MPIFLILLAVVVMAWNGLHDAIGLDSAARAGATVASSDYAVCQQNPASPKCSASTRATDAADAIAAEENVAPSTFTPITYGQTCTTGACVSVHSVAGTRSGVDIEVVEITQHVRSQLPLLNSMTVKADAGAEP